MDWRLWTQRRGHHPDFERLEVPGLGRLQPRIHRSTTLATTLPMMDNRRKIWLVACIAMAISLLAILLFHARAYDDPYITYRYAYNLTRGTGFVYNPGERVQSTTTPLFTLLLAALSLVWGDLPHLAIFIGALSLGAGGLLLWLLADTWQAPWAGWAGLLLYP